MFLIVVRRSPDGFYEEQDDDDFGPRIEALGTHVNGAKASDHSLVSR